MVLSIGSRFPKISKQFSAHKLYSEQLSYAEEKSLINKITSNKQKYVFFRHFFAFEERIYKSSKVGSIMEINKHSSALNAPAFWHSKNLTVP